MTAITVTHLERAPAPERSPAQERMQGGLALSASLHLGLLLLIVLGLPSLFRQPPPQETPIAVQLVTIAPETTATQPNPFRPKPEAKPEPPTAAPAPKPEPKPEPPSPAPPPPAAASAAPPPSPPQPAPQEARTPPPPPPPPKPVEAQAPAPPPPEAKPQPHQAQQPPRSENRKADPAAFDKLLKNLDDKKPEPASFDSLLKNLTKQPTAQTEDETPRPRPKVMAAAPPSSQPKAPLGSQLTASEIDALVNLVKQQLIPCWNVPAGARDAKDLNVQVRASVNLDGTVRQAVIVDQGRMSDPLIRAAAESARRTFFNPQCTPLKLPADKYEVWKDLVVNFDPRDLL